jgi:nucleoside 2-deoxyribosyltransferase
MAPHVLVGSCDRCGYVHIAEDAVAEANRLGKLHIISAWFRRINSSDVSRVKRLDIATIIADTPEYSVLEKLDLTLVAVDSKTPEPGQRSKFTPQNDYPLVYAKSAEEAAFYIRQLEELGYVKQESSIALVLAPGFKRLMEMQKSGRASVFVFVAMWFAEQMNDIYNNAIEPAIREAGYKPIRVDRIEHVNRIDDEIIGRIKASRFIVADFTGHRQGVYFEAGMMLGLGRTVIWMCKDDELAASHFDTRQYNFINYKSAEEARKRLYDRILAIEGAGPEKKDT